MCCDSLRDTRNMPSSCCNIPNARDLQQWRGISVDVQYEICVVFFYPKLLYQGHFLWCFMSKDWQAPIRTKITTMMVLNCFCPKLWHKVIATMTTMMVLWSYLEIDNSWSWHEGKLMIITFFFVNNSNTTYLATATTESIATHCIMGQSAFLQHAPPAREQSYKNAQPIRTCH